MADDIDRIISVSVTADNTEPAPAKAPWYMRMLAALVTGSFGSGGSADMPAGAPAPTLSSVDIAIGDRAGGIELTLAGTNLTGTTGVTLGGTACTGVVVDSDIQVRCTTPAKALGTYDIVLTTGGGSDTLVGAYEAWDPSDMSPTVWCRADYGGSPWADDSGNSRPFAEGTNPPATGATQAGALGNYTPADFDGTNDRIGSSVGDLDTYANAAAWTWWFLFRADTVPTDPGAGARYTTECLMSDNQAYLVISLTDSGVSAEIADGIGASDVSQAFGTGGYHLAVVYYNGTNVTVSVDGTAATPVAIGNIPDLTGAVIIGGNYDASAAIDGRMLEFGAVDTDQSAKIAKLKHYVNTRYGLSL